MTQPLRVVHLREEQDVAGAVHVVRVPVRAPDAGLGRWPRRGREHQRLLAHDTVHGLGTRAASAPHRPLLQRHPLRELHQTTQQREGVVLFPRFSLSRKK